MSRSARLSDICLTFRRELEIFFGGLGLGLDLTRGAGTGAERRGTVVGGCGVVGVGSHVSRACLGFPP